MSALKTIGGAVAGLIVGLMLFATIDVATRDPLNNNRSFFDWNGQQDLIATLFGCCGAAIGALAAIAHVIEHHARPPAPPSASARHREQEQD